MKTIQYFIGLVLIALIINGCGSTSKSTSGSQNSTSFNVNGSLNPAIVKTNSISPSTISSANVDYVYAVNTQPTYGSSWRLKAPINSDGTFSLVLTKGDPWIMAFIDSSKTGADMISGIFRANKLDSIVPKVDTLIDILDLEDLDLDPSTNIVEFVSANYSAKYDEFIGDLGMNSVQADALGDMDDLMLRYVNPDINGNGVIDMDETPAFNPNITYWVEYKNEQNLITANIKAGTELPPTLNVIFHSSKPQLRLIGVFDTLPGKLDVEWTNQGDYSSGSQAGLTPVEYDGEMHFQAGFDNTVTQTPTGTYTYKVYTNIGDASPNRTFTFTNVNTPADLSVIDNYVFPFPVFNADGNDDITSISYKWVKYNGTIFVDADAADIELIVGKAEAEVKWNEGPYAAWKTIKPYTDGFAVSGNFSINDVNGDTGHLTNMTLNRNAITSVSISFVSRLGMWMKLTIQ